jgi:hypothetical protein
MSLTAAEMDRPHSDPRIQDPGKGSEKRMGPTYIVDKYRFIVQRIWKAEWWRLLFLLLFFFFFIVQHQRRQVCIMRCMYCLLCNQHVKKFLKSEKYFRADVRDSHSAPPRQFPLADPRGGESQTENRYLSKGQLTLLDRWLDRKMAPTLPPGGGGRGRPATRRTVCPRPLQAPPRKGNMRERLTTCGSAPPLPRRLTYSMCMYYLSGEGC